MRIEFFGDSYDIFKQSLIAWLGELGPWSTHPMFTEVVRGKEARNFAQFLGVDLVSLATLTPDADRGLYFAVCRRAGHLFLDPDIGVSLERRGGSRLPHYLLGHELRAIARERAEYLTLVYDQSYSYGSSTARALEKVRFFAAEGVAGLVYWSHAPFILLSPSRRAVDRARRTLLRKSRLPAKRLVTLNAL